MTWPMVALGDVATIDRRTVDPASLVAQTPYVGLEHIESGGRMIGRSSVGESAVSSTKFTFGPEHVLYGKLRPYLGKIARPDFDGVCSTDILPIRPGASLDRNYLTHYLRQPSMVGHAAARATGANLPRLSPKELERFAMPLPPIEEQRRIAAILDRADTLIDRTKSAIEKIDLLEQALVSCWEPVAEAATLGELGWDFSTGKNVVAGAANGHPRNRVLKVSAISSGVFKADEVKPLPIDYEPALKHLVSTGDILFGRASGSLDLLGATAVVDAQVTDLYLPDKVWRLEVLTTQTLPRYALAVLRSRTFRDYVRDHASGAAGVRNIGKKTVLNYALRPLSPDHQAQFKEAASRADSVRDVAVGQLLGVCDLRRSLQARAFAGEL